MHLQEKLASDENIYIKRETLRSWAHDIHHVKRAKRRRSKVRKRRQRMSTPGVLLQMDGSSHVWFGDKKSCLLLLIDDASSEIHAEFFESESTSSCMKLLKDFIQRKGLFKALYVDRAGIYGGPKRCHFSQVQRACQEAGIEILFAHSPESKGRVERAFNTLQDRLIPELRLNNIQSQEQANEYLKNIFIPNYWNKSVTVQPENNDSEYKPATMNLKDIFIQKEYRKIRKDHTFSLNNKFYLIESALRQSIAQQEIEIRILQNNTFEAFFAGRKLDISEVKKPTKQTLYEPEIQEKIEAIQRAQKLGNISLAAKQMGVSRQTIHKNKKLLQKKGPMGLKRTFDSSKRHQNRACQELEKLVIEFSIQNPHLGQNQVALHINQKTQYETSPGGVRLIWLRHQLNNIPLRLLARENAKNKQAA